MKPSQTTPAAVRRLAGILGLVAVLLVMWCSPALAHARLVESTPAADARLSEAPNEVRLRFSEPVDAEFSPLEVYDPAGDRVDGDDARMDPEDARVVLASLDRLPEGSYEVRWRVTSVDGHVVDGTYGFVVQAPTAETTREVRAGETGGGEAASGSSESRDTGPRAGRVVALGFVSVSLVVLLVVVLRRRGS